MQEEKIKLIERERDAGFLARNVKAMEKVGWTNLIKVLPEIEEVVVKIDPVIILQGIKNPLYTTFVGFSTIKLIEALRRKKKVVRGINIIEPNLGVVKHLLCTEDISSIILDPTIDWFLGMEPHDLRNNLMQSLVKPIPGMPLSKTTMTESMEYIIDPFQYKDKDKTADELMEAANEAVRQLRLAMGCSDDQFIRWEMMLENKDVMLKSWKIGGLYDKFKEAPCFVLGGGPSLDDFIEKYNSTPSLRNSLIIAADAVLSRLLTAGIRPHIVVRCERKKTNIFEGITKEQTKGIYYAAYPWTPTDFFDLFEDVFYLFRHNGPCMFTGLDHGFADGGVSSGNIAYELAVLLGCKDIYFSGIDLCFIDGKSHTSGTQVEFNPNKSKAKWTQVKSNNGEEVTTIPVWRRCLNEYSQAVHKHQDAGKEFSTFNLSKNGVEIPLIPYKDLNDLDGLFDKDMDINGLINEHRKKFTKGEAEKFRSKIKEALEEVKKLYNIVDVADGLADEGKKTALREIEKLVLRVHALHWDHKYEFICALRQHQKNFDKLMGNLTEAYDLHFKDKCYPNKLFGQIIFDVMQLDLYQYENQSNIGKLTNTMEASDQRAWEYYKLTKDFTIRVKIYLDKFIDLFDKSIGE